MTFGRRDDRISIFGSLRPSANQTISRAVVTTYSLDLIAMLGLVLSLGGDTETEFEASPLGLVKAFDRVRGKLIVLHQLGRVVAPSAYRSVLPLLDTMVQAVAANERRGSWHPKTALARYASDAGVEWRFWIGSRNLTGSTDRDAGLLLVSSKEKAARQVPDICRLAEDLLADARMTSTELAELRSSRWLAPLGVNVRSIFWRHNGETRRFLETPLLARADRGCAVSPFVNPGGLAEVLKAGARNVSLLTTERAAADCSPYDGVSFRVDAAPEPAARVSVEQQQESMVGEFNEPPSTGIHAKLLAMSKGDRTVLMLGSANLTGRGLVGPNAEAVAILDITDPTLAQSLYGLVDGGIDLTAADIASNEDQEEERAKRELDDLISQFLECSFRLAYKDDGLHFIVGDGAADVLSLAQFEVSPFLESDVWTMIRPDSLAIRLVANPPPVSEQTSLVNFRAHSVSGQDAWRIWVQALEVDGVDTKRRDSALLAKYVGANRFRDWLRSLLDGVDGTGGQRWTDQIGAPDRQEPASQMAHIFTLETMLASWARNPEAFASRVGSMMGMLESFEEVFAAIPDDDERKAALADLEEVRPFLVAVYEAIGSPE